MHNLFEALAKLAPQVGNLCVALTTRIEHSKPGEILATKQDLQHWVNQLMKTQAEIDAMLVKIDVATTKIGTNVQTIADVDQKISDEIDAFIKAAPAGSALTDEQADQLQGFADRLQASSDASDAQVAVLKAIASKGDTNPIPVPVPPVPPVV